MTASLTPALDDLLETITQWPLGMPVRAMERILEAGDAAVPAVIEAVTRWHDDEEREVFWLLVLLGELRCAAAVPVLVRELANRDDDLLPVVAAEGLAKIGVPALSGLRAVLDGDDEWSRLHAYAALGWIANDEAYAMLTEALQRDRTLADIIAVALGDAGRSQAIPELYAAYQRCEPRQRTEIADTIRDLQHNVRRPQLWRRDWRLRYRVLDEDRGVDTGWLGISAIIRKYDDVTDRKSLPVQALEEIIASAPERLDQPLTCADCGATIEQPTGLPVCPETAVDTVVMQLELLKGVREQGVDDLFDVLDFLEAADDVCEGEEDEFDTQAEDEVDEWSEEASDDGDTDADRKGRRYLVRGRGSR